MPVRMIRWPEDQEAILDHIRLVHGQDDYEMLSAWYGSTPTFDPRDCFVIDGEHEGEVAAHAVIVPRHLQIGESILPTAEIGLLGVREEYRGHRYEHALLEAIHERMNEREDALGLSFGAPHLFEPWQYEYAIGLYLTSFESSIATDLALRSGTWDAHHSYERRTADRLGAQNRPLQVRRFYINDLPAIQALYAAEANRGHYSLARDEDTWMWQLNHMSRIGRNDPDDFLVAEVDNQIAAYARILTQGSLNTFRGEDGCRFSVVEAAGDQPDAIEALLAEISRTAQAFNAAEIGLFVHPQSAFMKHALVRGGMLRHFTGAGFVRLHHLPLTLNLLAPTLEARRLNSPFATRAYHLIVVTEHEEADVYLGRGDPEVVELEAPSTTLLRLFTGWYGASNLTMGYHERYADLVQVLFPRRDPKIALADLI